MTGAFSVINESQLGKRKEVGGQYQKGAGAQETVLGTLSQTAIHTATRFESLLTCVKPTCTPALVLLYVWLMVATQPLHWRRRTLKHP